MDTLLCPSWHKGRVVRYEKNEKRLRQEMEKGRNSGPQNSENLRLPRRARGATFTGGKIRSEGVQAKTPRRIRRLGLGFERSPQGALPAPGVDKG